ncbi:GGDEF domain-containing protein [Methylobacillus gramineus]|uniref:GGDEF domain-containing protein n=1 Tax=Methylobacillus gramineus TaxID=755169 RepID=UPI001CFFCC80|nr:GGDEF domain-containing protein [Methylobacillus gramineus]MCB5185674.1 GGDEF domain-containing protein [Methylobacillus gramineus]
MDHHNKSVETARQTLIQLAKSRIEPTPENYRKVYNAINGSTQAIADESLSVSKLLGKVLHEIDAQHPHHETVRSIIFQIEEQNWPELEGVLRRLFSNMVLPEVAQASAYHLELSGNGDLIQLWRDMLVKTLDLVVIPQLKSIPEVESRTRELLSEAKLAETRHDILKLEEALKSILFTLEMQLDSQSQLQLHLLQLLRLLLVSMEALLLEDKWLQGPTAAIREILSSPLNIDSLIKAECTLKDLIFMQGQLKPGLVEAKKTLKKMASIFVTQLSELTEATGEYQTKLEGYQEEISHSDEIKDLNQILSQLLEDTRIISVVTQRSREEILDAQNKVRESEKQIYELTLQLDHINEIAHEDYLTGTLNRRGMDEALIREFSRADRFGMPLSIAMMDIDHFKQINDNMGHATGDQALAHLAAVIKESLRTTDVIARYGGEEFIILLPGTSEKDAISVITRAQRELTRNFFMHDRNRVLITFSAGVAERMSGEDADTVIGRTDKALYQAKNSGRNRVIGATSLATPPAQQ